MQALAEYESGVCACGFHESIADEDPDLETTVRVCPVCANWTKNGRVLAARDEAELREVYRDQKPPPEADRPDDGRHLGLRAKMPGSESQREQDSED